jgi:DNA repair protein RecN (Recombination protein N)
MLLELTIKDFAIIDYLNLHLHRQFNVFTGETGAGKSIIIDAVNALLGGKVGVEFVRAGCERASVEGVFWLGPLPSLAELPADNSALTPTDRETRMLHTVFEHAPDYHSTPTTNSSSAAPYQALAAILREYDILTEDGQLILSRDIFRSGRTVSRINGRAFSQHILQQVASWLIDIHGQSEHMSLLRTEQHINFLDRYADTLSLREELARKVSAWRETHKKLHALQQNIRDQERRAAFLRYEIEDIKKAELRTGEEDELLAERKVLSNAERLRELSTFIYSAIKGTDVGDSFQAALDQLRQAQRSLRELVRLDKNMREYEDTLAETIYQLEDVASAINSYEADIEDDPNQLTTIEERLDLITKMKRKYGDTIEDILQRATDDRAELATIEGRDETILKLQQQDRAFRKAIGSLAQQLSHQRHEAAQHLATAMEAQLNDLNMRRARFQVEITHISDTQGVPASLNNQPVQLYSCNQTGVDHVQFLIAPNPGEPFKPLTKIASGGETSRLMLALKTILTHADTTPTLIFDEIDTGISGRSGQVVGEKLWQLTHNHQVICVTHLPQIAAFADTHYNVNKQIIDNRTITIINELQPEQRIREIAHIMGGSVSEFSLKIAAEMLDRSNLWKENWLSACPAS